MSLANRAATVAASSDGQLLWQVTANSWHPEKNPGGVVNLGMAENVLMQESTSKHIKDHFSFPEQGLTYGDGTTGSNRLKRSMARFVTKHFRAHKQVEASDITITNGCSAAIEHLAWATAEPGSGFLVGQPYFRAFIPTTGLRVASKVIEVSHYGIDPFSYDIIQCYENKLHECMAQGQKIAGIILCNPHNPLGRCYPRTVLVGIMRLCQKYQLHLISDEVYALSTWTNTIDSTTPNTPFISCLSIDVGGLIDRSLVHVVWGVSKDFGANGIRLGAIISQSNPDLHKALVPAALYSMSSSLADQVVSNILEDEEWVDQYLAENRQRMSSHYNLMAQWALSNDVAYAKGANAGFFMWVNLGSAYVRNHPGISDQDLETRVMSALMAKKIFAAPGKSFGAEYPGWFRLVFTVDSHTLREGLDRITSVLRNSD